ncbi:MAG: tail fiber domain-containing protein [Ferruginibacter sp.]
MKYFYFGFILFINCLTGKSQSVSINNDKSAPHASAILDVKSAVKGMLLPRTSTISRIAIVNPAKGLLLYDTTTSGFWFHNGAAWTQFSDGSNAWNLTGNIITNSDTHFIGSINNQPLRFRVSDTWAGEIHPTSGNVFFGLDAGNANTTGLFNTGIGGHSLFAVTNGSYNTAAGYDALYSNTTGSQNTAQGAYSLFSNTTGYHNSATGTDALNSNSAGIDNTANGYRALFMNTTGYYNTANGSQALNSNTSGTDNTANGYNALNSNNTGSVNTAIGESALRSNSTGNNNTGVGFNALFFNNTGDDNTAIGYNALAYNKGGHNNIAIGVGSGTASYSVNTYNTISIGNDDILNGYQNQVLIGNTSTGYIGGQVTWSTYSDARIKNTIAEDVKGLDFILRLRPVTYHISQKAITALTGNKNSPDFPGKYDNEKTKYTGFLAQEVEMAAKAAGYDFSGYATPKNQWGLYTISYEQFVVPLVKAMQEQQTIIENLEKKMAVMKIEMDLLKKNK